MVPNLILKRVLIAFMFMFHVQLASQILKYLLVISPVLGTLYL